MPHIYASVNRDSSGSENGLSPIWRQTIIWTSAGMLSIGLLGTKFSEILIEMSYIFIPKKKCIENVVCETAPILSGGRWVNCLKQVVLYELLMYPIFRICWHVSVFFYNIYVATIWGEHLNCLIIGCSYSSCMWYQMCFAIVFCM